MGTLEIEVAVGFAIVVGLLLILVLANEEAKEILISSIVKVIFWVIGLAILGAIILLVFYISRR